MAKLHLWGDSVTCEEAARATIGLKRKKDSVFHRLSEIADVSAMAKEERHYECLQKVLYITWQSNTL